MSDVKLQSRMTSIFLLTSIFNESIHSSIAVFHLDRIHEQWKGRIETWQQRKRVVRKRRAARRSNCSSSHKDRGRASVPFVIPVAPLQTARQSSHGNDASAPDATRRGATPAAPLFVEEFTGVGSPRESVESRVSGKRIAALDTARQSRSCLDPSALHARGAAPNRSFAKETATPAGVTIAEAP